MPLCPAYISQAMFRAGPQPNLMILGMSNFISVWIVYHFFVVAAASVWDSAQELFVAGNAANQAFLWDLKKSQHICWQCGKLRIAQNHEELLGCLYADIVTLSTGGKKHDHTLNKIRDVEGSERVMWWQKCHDSSKNTTMSGRYGNDSIINSCLHLFAKRHFEEVVIAFDGTFCVTRWGTGKPSVKWWLILGGCGVLQLKKFDLIATTRWKQGLFLVGCETQQASSEFDGPYELW